MTRRLLVVHSSDEMYGSDRILLQVVDALAAEPGIMVDVWLPNDVAHGPTPLCVQLESRGIAVRHIALPVLRRANLTFRGMLATARSAWRLWRALDRRYDGVYCMTSACLPVAPLARARRIRFVVLHAQEVWSGVEAVALRLLAAFTTLRIANSQWVAESTRLTRPTPVVIDNCVAAPSSSMFDRRARGRSRPLVFVVASRWTPRKGYGTLIDGWELAGCPGTLLVLGGPPPSGSAVDVPQLVATRVSRPESVQLIGEVPDAMPYIAESDVLLLPSDLPEGFGLVVIEAFSLGIPAVASHVGGPIGIIDQDCTGWFFRPGDAQDLAAVLAGLDIETIRAAGDAARAVYEQRYTPAVFQDRIREVVATALLLR